MAKTTNKDGSTTDKLGNGGSVTIYDSSKGQNASGTGSGKPSGGSSSSGSSGSSYSGGSYSGGSTGNSYGGSSGGNTNTSTPKVPGYTGGTGKVYQSGPDGMITVIRPDGSTSTVRPGDANYQATVNAGKADGYNYLNPTTNYTNSYGDNYTSQSYLSGNPYLQYALQQALQQDNANYANGGKSQYNGSIGTGDYVKNLYNNIGQKRDDGSVKTLDDVNRELDRLGLSDYRSDKAIYTAGGTILPGNQYGSYKTGADGSNSADSRWYTYGGRDYLVGGDSANYAQYANGKTNNLDNLSFLFGNMANNSYAQKDPQFLMAYLEELGKFNAMNGNQINANANGQMNNSQLAGDLMNYYASANNYYGATGSGGGSNLLAQIEQLLKGQLNSTNSWLDSQRTMAETDARELARQAWVNGQLSEDKMREGLAASGLGTSGALQQGQLGVQSNYNNALADINANKQKMISSLDEQGVKALSDYYGNMTNYSYQVSSDEANRQIQQQQMALQQQQMEWERQAQQQQMAWQQAYQQMMYDFDQKKYQTSLDQYASETDWNKSQQAFENALSNADRGILTQDTVDRLFNGDVNAANKWLASQMSAKKSSSGGSSGPTYSQNMATAKWKYEHKVQGDDVLQYVFNGNTDAYNRYYGIKNQKQNTPTDTSWLDTMILSGMFNPNAGEGSQQFVSGIKNSVR